MDISLPEDNTGKCYLPTGVDGAGIATKKFLDSNGAISKLDQKERQKLQDSRVIMKAYLISKLVAARYTFEDGHMEFNERAESNHIDMMEYKGTFQTFNPRVRTVVRSAFQYPFLQSFSNDILEHIPF